MIAGRNAEGQFVREMLETDSSLGYVFHGFIEDLVEREPGESPLALLGDPAKIVRKVNRDGREQRHHRRHRDRRRQLESTDPVAHRARHPCRAVLHAVRHRRPPADRPSGRSRPDDVRRAGAANRLAAPGQADVRRGHRVGVARPGHPVPAHRRAAGQAHQQRSGPLLPGPRRARRRTVRHAQAAHDGRRRRSPAGLRRTPLGDHRPALQDRERPPDHPGRQVAAPPLDPTNSRSCSTC